MVLLVGCSETHPECDSAEDCSDGNPCTEDACEATERTCSHTPVDDGTGCSFDGAVGVCVSSVCGENLCEGVVCEDDDNECTGDVCNVADGTCNVPDGTACGSGACLDGDCTALTTVSGTVRLHPDDVGPSVPAADATVSVVGTSLSTTTDDDGNFSFDVFAGDWFLHASKEGTWTRIDLHNVPTSGSQDLSLSVTADAVMTQFEQALGRNIDDTKGAVWMDFYPGHSGLGGETATLSESYEFGSTPGANGEPVLSDKLLPDGDSTLQFWNVDLTQELTVTPMGVEGVNQCRLSMPGTLYPVIAKAATFVIPHCERVP
jgi:hypothetical protein